jgi:hypothetical protein
MGHDIERKKMKTEMKERENLRCRRRTGEGRINRVRIDGGGREVTEKDRGMKSHRNHGRFQCQYEERETEKYEKNI